MEIAFHCPNCSADLIFDESKSYTCCFCHTVLTGKDEVTELEGGYYVGDAWNEKVYHVFHCEDCGGEFIAKPANANIGCPICASTSLKDKGGIVGPMPRRAIPFSHTKQQAQEMFLDYIRNNSAVGRTLATDENKELLHKAYVPIWLFTYEVIAHAKVTASLRNKAAESKTLFGINGTEAIAESLTAIRSSFSRFQANRKGAAKETNDGTSEHVTGGVLSWQGIPFDASGVLPTSVINNLQPYDQSKMVLLNEKVLMDTPVLIMTKDPISCMQDFMERIKKWTRQMIIDAHSDSYDISYFQDKTDYPLGIGELVLFPIWYMKGEYMGREYFFAMNGQNGEIDANVPMTKGTTKSAGITYQQYWDKSRCTALNDTHFEFNIHDPNIEVLDYSFFEKPKESRVTPEGRIAPKSSSAAPASLDDVFENAAEALSGGKAPASDKPVQKKKFSEMEMEIGFGKKKKDPEKPLTKEEEMEREREMIARLRAAAKEEPRDPNGAASVPSWAKAVTPPPSQTTAARPTARTKKGTSATRSSVAASANKPIWEKTEEDLLAEKEASKKPTMSMAERMARKDEATTENKPARGFTGGLGAMNQDMELEDLDKMLTSDPMPPMHMKVPDKYKTPAASAEETAFREQIAAPSHHEDDTPESYEIPMPKVTPKPSARKAPVRRKVVEPQPEPVVEEPVIEEAVPEEETEMMANITFSFNKKKPAMSGEEKPVTETAIPRQPEKEPERAQGMPIMNSEYESGYLNRTEIEREVSEGGVREIVPNIPKASENYVGSDENDRPLSSRPAAPLARMRGDVRVETTDRKDLAPEDDITNRPLAERPPAPLARATESSGPTLEYLAEHELDDEIHAMPSIESNAGLRWGEMPEAKGTPSWAKPQESDDSPSPFRPNPRDRGRSHMSRDELRASEEDAVRKASASLAAHNAAGPRARTLADRRRIDAEEAAQEQERANSPFRPARPAAERPAIERQATERPMGRPAGRPAPRAAAEEPKKQVPIWERVPETDGPIPAWGASAAFVDDERPRGSLMKPKGQIIDVEKPREGTGLWKPDGSVKEVLLPGGARVGSAEEEKDNERELPAPEAREVAPTRPSRPQVERPAPPRGAAIPSARPVSRPAVERPAARPAVERPAARPSVERPAAERPMGRPSARPMGRPGNAVIEEAAENRSSAVTEDESAPITFSSDRPRTYAQRRQMEEEERRREIQSSFVNPEKQRAPIRRPSLRPADLRADLPDEDEPVNKTFESSQFENKPSVVASLDMLPEPLGEENIHHLAKDSYTPALARGTDEIQEELAQGEKIAKKAMRGLPDYDPDGPSPFKPNRNR